MSDNVEEKDSQDPMDISKEPEVCKDAQEELSKTDVLVCGECHEVSYFIEEFSDHKSDGKCPKIPGVRCENEEKPQIWAFTLWKVKQMKLLKTKGEEVPSSWEIYQNWIKLPTEAKTAWVLAGQTLQSNNRIATAKLQEITPIGDLPEVKEEADVKTPPRYQLLVGDTNRGIRSDKKEEFIVERIVGKRFNPRKRFWEYQVKWENYMEQTWEPLTNLENCRDLVDDFETKLKEQKEKDKPKGRGRPRVSVTPKKPEPIVTVIPEGGRPQRSSKQKALSQVRQWCGNISDSEDFGSGKRAHDDDSDDFNEKKAKTEEDSEDSEEEAPKMAVKKQPVAKMITYNNGVGRKGLPDNVLIPDSKGVVRISQKQLPSLSSGVYIMSRSSGIIRLDPAASKIATSGGQAIVKVGPKIGQTQIRIIKKDERINKEIAIAPKVGNKVPIPSLTPRIVTAVVKKEEKKTPVVVKRAHEPQKPLHVPKPKVEEESDDGIEELEFPTDIPLPTPESPPGDFVLDPSTGKIAGEIYPSPEPEPTIHEIPAMKADNLETIDNIVKLAAADITEDDLKTDQVKDDAHTSIKSQSTTTKPSPSILTTAIANSNILQKTLMGSPIKQNKPRILNQSMTKPKVTVTQVVRSSPKPQIIRQRPHQATPRPKLNVTPPFIRKVGNSNSVQPPKTRGIIRQVIKPKVATPTPRPSIISNKPKPIISMPSLNVDEEVVTPVIKNNRPAGVLMSSALDVGDDESPVFITGDDGTVYRVAGQNEDGQTVLVTEDSNGQQQCLLVTSESVEEEIEKALDDTPTTPQPASATTEDTSSIAEAMEVPEDTVHAEVLSAEPPSPGGTRKVMVMLPTGEVMVTQMSREDCANLELN